MWMLIAIIIHIASCVKAEGNQAEGNHFIQEVVRASAFSPIHEWHLDKWDAPGIRLCEDYRAGTRFFTPY